MTETDFNECISTLVHDIKSPLRTIAGFCNILDKELLSEPNKKCKEYLHIIQKTSNDLSLIVENIVSYYKVPNNTSNYEAVNLRLIIDNVINTLRYAAQNRKIQYNININECIFANKTQFIRLFLNLVDNSIKYSDINKELILDFNSYQEDKFYIISVKDNARGIEQSTIDNILNNIKLFDNVSNSIDKNLGLCICNQIIQNHNGFMKIHSKINIGTNFLIYLPNSIVYDSRNNRNN